MKRSAKLRAKRRREARNPWQPLLPAPFGRTPASRWDVAVGKIHDRMKGPDEEVFINDQYQVHREGVPKDQHGFGDFNLVWLSIKPRDKSARHDWREFQLIKNQLAGPDWEAIELYPSESRLIDSANQFHLWCFPPEAGSIPLGWHKRFVMEENISTYGSQRKWEDNLRPTDLETAKEFLQKIEDSEKEKA